MPTRHAAPIAGRPYSLGMEAGQGEDQRQYCTVAISGTELDGLSHPDIHQMANMGSAGLHVNNTRRDSTRANVGALL